ncbi:MAG: hypothetical protein IT381_13105 [Deltaproteobacteria bacterium]|nr:hypothetical protein [Deltaproteobacteria bacterium]
MSKELRSLEQIGVGLAIMLAVLSLFSGHQQRSFDAYVHMFFADHYLRSWFDLWDPRWYGGFSVASYPPLAHQTLAILSALLPRETAYALLTAAVMTALPLSVGAFARIFCDARTAALAVIIAALWPVQQRVAYNYGQLPTLFAAPIVLFATAQLDAFCRGGLKRNLLRYGFLMGAMAGAHHQTMLFGAYASMIVGCAHVLFGQTSRGALVRRILSAGAVAGVAVVTVGWPVILYGAQGPQTEIPHFSRDPLWERLLTLDLVQQVGSALVVLIAALALIWKRLWHAAFFAGAAFFFFVLSFGTTTPLPDLMFRAMARYFVYDRFTFWGCLLGAPVIAAAIVHVFGDGPRVRLGLVFALLPLNLLTVSFRESARQPAFIEDLSPMLAVLNAPGAERFRHLTLGFGDQMCRLDMESRSPNADGDYHAARALTMLKESGIAALDTCKYFPQGPDVLKRFLGMADALSLRWVLVYDEWYHPHLFESGYELAEVWPNGVTLFERTVPPLVAKPTPPSGFGGIVWGTFPLACLVISAALAVLARHRRITPK